MNGQMELCARKVKVWSTGRCGLRFGDWVKRGPRWGKLNVCHGSRAHVRVYPVLVPERLPMCCRCVCRSIPSSRPILRGRRRTRLRWLWWLCHRRSASGLLRSGWGLSHCLAAARGSVEHSDKSDMKGGGRCTHTHSHTLFKRNTKVHEGHCGVTRRQDKKRNTLRCPYAREKSHTYLCVIQLINLITV